MSRKYSKQSIQARNSKSQKFRFSGLYRNKDKEINLKILKISDNFFIEFPHFEVMKHNYLNYKNKRKESIKINLECKDNEISLSNSNYRNPN
jgi:hypothetical protein